MLFGEEPRKQKTRRPERRGITRAVSPKKIGKERKECPSSGKSERRESRKGDRRGSNTSITAAMEVADDGVRACEGYSYRKATIGSTCVALRAGI